MDSRGLERAIGPGLATRSDISVEDSLRMEVDVVDNAPLDMLEYWSVKESRSPITSPSSCTTSMKNGKMRRHSGFQMHRLLQLDQLI